MAQIIGSMFAESREQVLRLASKAAMAGADWLELRLDRWPAGVDLGPVLAAVRLPVLVTCHTPENGGSFRGTLGERRELLTEALLAGGDEVVCEIDGRTYRQGPFKYQGKCLEWLRAEYAALPSDARSRVDALLAGTGCEVMFA